jgi:hypothetical protein
MSKHEFSFDGAPESREVTCAHCGKKHDGDTGFVLDHGTAFAVFYADWYPHSDEAWVEVILGTFEQPDYADDVTIGCRYGYVDGQEESVASLFTPTRSGDIFGRVLDRADALKSDRIDDFWAVTDWLIVNDPLLNRTAYRLPSRSIPSD